METATFELGGAELSEALPQMRWVPSGRGLGLDADFSVRTKLQQAWRISVQDKDGRTWGTRIEWRDVPTEMNPS